MSSVKTQGLDAKDQFEKIESENFSPRWLFVLIIADLIFFTLFGFLFLVPIIVRLNLLIVFSLTVTGVYYTIKNRDFTLTSILVLLLSLAIFYANFMMLFGNRVSELLHG